MPAPPVPIKCKKAFTATSPSDWVHAFGLTCDDTFWVYFKKHQRIILRPPGYPKHKPYPPGPLLGVGGIPAVCCLYPGTAGAVGRWMYNTAIVWAYAGEFVHRFLYKKWAYQIVAPPALPCVGCKTTTSVSASLNPSCSGQPVTFTATISDSDGAAIPTGTVTFSSDKDGALCSNVAVDATGKATCTLSSLSVNTHTITATFTGTGGFQNSSGTVSQVVNTCQNQCGCATVPNTLTATFSGALAGTITLTWQSGSSNWQGTGALCGGHNTLVTFNCTGGNSWNLVGQGQAGGCGWAGQVQGT
jgi:hypothetical protein